MNDLERELISTAIVDASKVLFAQAWNADRRRETSQDRNLGSIPSELSIALGESLTRLTDVGSISDSLGGESLREFLRSTECVEIVADVFVVQHGDDPGTIEKARRAFALSAAHFVAPQELDSDAIHRLFDVICAGISEFLAAAVDRGALAAKDAQDSYRDQQMRRRLDTIDRKLEMLSSRSMPAHAEIERFAVEFRRVVAETESRVLPPSFKTNRRVPLDAVYVAPRLTLQIDDQRQEEFSYESLVRDLDRVVVLGDPGGGKSTLTQKFCADLSASSSEGEQKCVFRVLMRDYQSALAKESISLLDFVGQLPAIRYQMARPSEGTVEYLLQTGRAIVLFDGLDEILDVPSRVNAASAIERFANAFPLVRILVTSRRIGYNQAPLREDVFLSCQLSQFDQGQVREYVEKWFRLEGAGSASNVEEVVDSFMQQSATVPDLRSNPLLLGLMCNLYSGERSIPSNRPEVYSKCTVMMFERWDEQRGLRQTFSFASQLRPTMQRLAHWLYFDPELSAGVTEIDLVERTTSILHERRFRDLDEARSAASQFVDLCKGRAWLFTNTGTHESGEELFEFTHRTFLEYLTAERIAGLYSSPEEFSEFMIPLVEHRESDVVLQLAVQIQDSRGVGTADRIVEILLNRADEPVVGRNESANLIGFVVEALKYVVPAPDITRRIVNSALDFVADHGSVLRIDQTHSSELTEFDRFEDVLATVVRGVFAVGEEVIDEAQSAVKTWQIDRFRADNQARVAFEVLLSRWGMFASRRQLEPREWSSVMEEVFAEASDAVRRIADGSPYASMGLVLHEKITVERVIERWGFDCLFEAPAMTFSPSTYSLPFAQQLILSALSSNSGASAAEEMLECLGDAFVGAPVPWVNVGGSDVLWASAAPGEISQDVGEKAIIAIFCATAVVREGSVDEVTGRLGRGEVFPGAPSGSRIEALSQLFQAHAEGKDAPSEVLHVAFGNSGFSDVASKWVSRQVQFVGR